MQMKRTIQSRNRGFWTFCQRKERSLSSHRKTSKKQTGNCVSGGRESRGTPKGREKKMIVSSAQSLSLLPGTRLYIHRGLNMFPTAKPTRGVHTPIGLFELTMNEGKAEMRLQYIGMVLGNLQENIETHATGADASRAKASFAGNEKVEILCLPQATLPFTDGQT